MQKNAYKWLKHYFARTIRQDATGIPVRFWFRPTFLTLEPVPMQYRLKVSY